MTERDGLHFGMAGAAADAQGPRAWRSRLEAPKRQKSTRQSASNSKQLRSPNCGPLIDIVKHTYCHYYDSHWPTHTIIMSKHTDTPDIGKLNLEDDEDLFASPESGATIQKQTPTSNASSAQKQRGRSHSEAREARLKAELERVREVNRVIEGVTASLTKAKENMGTVQRTVVNASTLLATWTRILSQTEHNQRLILNPNWHGASQDVEDIENEEVRWQHETERRAVEEQRRREEAQRRAEEEERRRAVATPSTRGASKTRGTRGTRGTSSSSRGYTGVGGQTGRGRGTAGTRGSGIGRGTSATRGRGRGLG